MNLKRWKMGLLVSLLSGLFVGLISAGIDLSFKQTVIMVLVAICKDGQLYLMKHPIEEVQDTQFITRPPDSTPKI